MFVVMSAGLVGMWRAGRHGEEDVEEEVEVKRVRAQVASAEGAEVAFAAIGATFSYGSQQCNWYPHLRLSYHFGDRS